MGRLRYRLTLLSLLTLAAVASFSTVADAEGGLRDSERHPYWRAIGLVNERGILGADADGNFRPRDPILRADFTESACRLLHISPEPETISSFPDVSQDEEGFITAAKNTGLVVGYQDGLFRPGEPMTRELAIVILVRGVRATYPGLLAMPPERGRSAADGAGLDAGAAYNLAELNHLLDELPVFDLGRRGPMSRGEAAKLLANTLVVVGDADR